MSLASEWPTMETPFACLIFARSAAAFGVSERLLGLRGLGLRLGLRGLEPVGPSATALKQNRLSVETPDSAAAAVCALENRAPGWART